MFGLVAITNAEKVILDRIKEENGQISLFEESDDEKDKQANELRNLIGKLPSLSIFIDEVHHAVSDEIKLRAVVTKWAQNHTVNSVIGFSGTPYLEKIEKFKVVDSLTIGTAEITNIVYYYPLVNGIGNFLKRPVVKISEDRFRQLIIIRGVEEFLDAYKDTIYEDGTTAKLGIYCGSIEKLEEVVYPIVSSIVTRYGLGVDTILKFHKGNKQYKMSADSQMQFDTLDKPISSIRIVLLVQVGKEGWDCRSLTGIILSQEGDCPTNMVLQTSCRCLRQVVKGCPETALIYLNESNAEKLNVQLQKQHHISLREFIDADNTKVALKRYDRTKYLKLPKVDFYQLKINYNTVTIDEANPAQGIAISASTARIEDGIIRTTDLSMNEDNTIIQVDDAEYGTEYANFNSWVYGIMKGGFGHPAVSELMEHAEELRSVYEQITFEKEDVRYFSSKYNHKVVEANIRKAFRDKADFDTTEELIPEEASLLNITNFTPEFYTERPQDYYPKQEVVERIIKDDNGKLKVDVKMEETIRFLEENGNFEMAATLRAQNTSHKNKNRSFHYLPYRTDSSVEQTFLRKILALDDIENLGLEVYYNGDRAMTEFKIKCYKQNNNKWSYVGIYTPDFLIIKRKDGEIHKIIVVETKGEIYANDPVFSDKKSFMETEFVNKNNIAYGYKRFDYLYLEDTLSENEWLSVTSQKIKSFFKEGI